MQALRRGTASRSLEIKARFSPRISHFLPSTCIHVAKFSTFPPSQFRALATSKQCSSHKFLSLRQSRWASIASAPSTPPKGSEDRITNFSELSEQGLVNPAIIQNLTEGMGIKQMTDVQSLTINATLNGADTVAQARTGTGKTLAFLIPIVQNILKADPTLANRTRSPPGSERLRNIRALVISPTRELAEQIAVEARKVVQGTDIAVQTAVGGTGKRFGLMKIRDACHILVGTPGRLKDILSDPYSRIEAPNLSILVLDEADRLLEQGFEEEIREIQGLLPDKRKTDRQTLLFSATISREIMPVVRSTMKRDFQLVKTVADNEQPTHERVPQKLANVRNLENLMPAVAELCMREIKAATEEKPFKAVIFYPTLNEVTLAASTMNYFGRPARNDPSQPALPRTTRVFELHSDLSQRERTAAADSFRRAPSALLICSDVAARGMDFPGVTHVIQVGLPPNQDQYIHRIGRTARAGKTGEAWLFITDLEAREIRDRLPQMPLKADTSLEAAKLNLQRGSLDEQTFLSDELKSLFRRIYTCIAATPARMRFKVFSGTFNMFAWQRKDTIVNAANARATTSLGFEPAPPVPYNIATKLNLFRVPGINIADGNSGGTNAGFGGPSSDGRRMRDYGGNRSYGDRPRRDAGIEALSSDAQRMHHYGNNQLFDDRSSKYGQRGGRSYEPRKPRSAYGSRDDGYSNRRSGMRDPA